MRWIRFRHRRDVLPLGLTVTLVVASGLLAGCAGGDAATNEAAASTGERCTTPAGSWTDLTNEFWIRDETPHVRWTDESGCLIHLESVFHRWAAEECGWQRVQVISIGLPIGTPYTGPDAQPPGQDWVPAYVHNTAGDFPRIAPGETIDTGDRPPTAIDTGLRDGDRELWIETDESLLYLSDGSTTLVFTPDPEDEVGTCA